LGKDGETCHPFVSNAIHGQFPALSGELAKSVCTLSAVKSQIFSDKSRATYNGLTIPTVLLLILNRFINVNAGTIRLTDG
jgi:hypothetical protein